MMLTGDELDRLDAIGDAVRSGAIVGVESQRFLLAVIAKLLAAVAALEES